MRFMLVLITMLLSIPALAGEGVVTIAVVTQERDPVKPISPLDQEIRDEGVAGARLGSTDNATTGRFTGQVSGSSSAL
jgi:hypothetical protein